MTMGFGIAIAAIWLAIVAMTYLEPSIAVFGLVAGAVSTLFVVGAS